LLLRLKRGSRVIPAAQPPRRAGTRRLPSEIYVLAKRAVRRNFDDWDQVATLLAAPKRSAGTYAHDKA
jgi:hypothetical protein